MKTIILNFIQRGLMACGFGPIVLAIVYFFLQRYHVLEIITVQELCLGIFTCSALAFIAGGSNVLYQIERLPLLMAILIHAVVLYFSYLTVYLINGWLKWGMVPLLVFTVIFIAGYLAIWAIIYTITRSRTNTLNKILNQKRLNADAMKNL